MKKYLVVLVALCAVSCGGTTSAPTPIVTPPMVIVTPPPVVSAITVSACPDAVVGLDLTFYRQIGCNAFDGPLQPLRRWTAPPQLYIRTVDEGGAPIDAVTLETVATTLSATAPIWMAGKNLVSIERGLETREGRTGWITVKWPIAGLSGFCGRSDVGRDGGVMEFNTVSTTCGCNGSKIRPLDARHELGHALGYWHTGDAGDVMSGLPNRACDQQPSARERSAAAYHYR